MASINFHSSEWATVYNVAQEKIQEHVAALCSINCPPEKTQILRGRIDALRELIAQDELRYKEFKINPFS